MPYVNIRITGSLSREQKAWEPLSKSHMTAHSVLRDGGARKVTTRRVIPFVRNLTPQTARKASARKGCS